MDPIQIFGIIGWFLTVHQLDIIEERLQQQEIDIVVIESEVKSIQKINENQDTHITALHNRVDNIIDYIIDNPSAASGLIEE